MHSEEAKIHEKEQRLLFFLSLWSWAGKLHD